MDRDYKAQGLKALSPPTVQLAGAVFALEELSWERFRLQFGARAETNHYTPQSGSISPETGLPYFGKRFTGISFSTGASSRCGTADRSWPTTFTPTAHRRWKSYTATARIRGTMFSKSAIPDSSCERVRTASSFHCATKPTDFGSKPTSSTIRCTILFILSRPGLLRRTCRRRVTTRPIRIPGSGGGRLDVALHPSLWLLTGFDVVDAKIVATDMPLPRIPPVRGRVGLDWRHRGLSVPSGGDAHEQAMDGGPSGKPTAGYVLSDLTVSYSFARRHTMHQFHLNCFNLGDILYRNHLSFIKEYAPEIGRGIRFGYTFQWF